MSHHVCTCGLLLGVTYGALGTASAIFVLASAVAWGRAFVRACLSRGPRP